MYKLENIDFGIIIRSLLLQDSVTDIMIWNGEIWVTDINKGHYQFSLAGYEKSDISQMKELLAKIPRQLALRMQLPYNDAEPILDGEAIFKEFGQLRFNCIHENVNGTPYPAIAIRKSKETLRVNEDYLLTSGFMPEKVFRLLKALVKSGCNIMISGQTGSGKTELLRFLAKYIPINEAIITIEDTYEAYLKNIYPHKNVLSLKESENISISDLLKTCLRQNPDWICISETRGKEVVNLLESLSTGHHMISTIHADNAFNIPMRMLEMSKVNMSASAQFYRQIFSHLDIGVHLAYYNDDEGSHRRISEIVEFYLDGFEERINYLYRYDFNNGKETYNNIVSSRILQKISESRGKK